MTSNQSERGWLSGPAILVLTVYGFASGATVSAVHGIWPIPLRLRIAGVVMFMLGVAVVALAGWMRHMESQR